MLPHRILTKNHRGAIHYHGKNKIIFAQLVPCKRGTKGYVSYHSHSETILSGSGKTKRQALDNLNKKLLSIARKVRKYKTNEGLRDYFLVSLGLLLSDYELANRGYDWRIPGGYKTIRSIADRMLALEVRK